MVKMPSAQQILVHVQHLHKLIQVKGVVPAAAAVAFFSFGTLLTATDTNRGPGAPV